MSVAHCKITHVPTDRTLEFPIIIKTFEYDISPRFTETQVYGRMDPIFTYQQTSRRFTAVLATPGGSSGFTQQQKDTFLRTGFMTQNDWNGLKLTPTITRRYLSRIADLFKMMYPVYNTPTNDGTGFMSASPLLRLDLNGLTHKSDKIPGLAPTGDEGSAAQGLAKGLLFVPQTFKVTSIVDSALTGLTVASAEDLRFSANAEGYVITLGGTILHENNRVGMYFVGDSVAFGQGRDFPFATGGKATLYADPDIVAPEAAAGSNEAPGSPGADATEGATSAALGSTPHGGSQPTGP